MEIWYFLLSLICYQDIQELLLNTIKQIQTNITLTTQCTMYIIQQLHVVIKLVEIIFL